jgi:hypothetical protein
VPVPPPEPEPAPPKLKPVAPLPEPAQQPTPRPAAPLSIEPPVRTAADSERAISRTPAPAAAPDTMGALLDAALKVGG